MQTGDHRIAQGEKQLLDSLEDRVFGALGTCNDGKDDVLGGKTHNS